MNDDIFMWSELYPDMQRLVRNYLSYAEHTHLGLTCKKELVLAFGVFEKITQTYCTESCNIILDKTDHIISYHRSLASDGNTDAMLELLRNIKIVDGRLTCDPRELAKGAIAADRWDIIEWLSLVVTDFAQIESWPERLLPRFRFGSTKLSREWLLDFKNENSTNAAMIWALFNSSERVVIALFNMGVVINPVSRTFLHPKNIRLVRTLLPLINTEILERDVFGCMETALYSNDRTIITVVFDRLKEVTEKSNLAKKPVQTLDIFVDNVFRGNDVAMQYLLDINPEMVHNLEPEIIESIVQSLLTNNYAKAYVLLVKYGLYPPSREILRKCAVAGLINTGIRFDAILAWCNARNWLLTEADRYFIEETFLEIKAKRYAHLLTLFKHHKCQTVDEAREYIKSFVIDNTRCHPIGVELENLLEVYRRYLLQVKALPETHWGR